MRICKKLREFLSGKLLTDQLSPEASVTQLAKFYNISKSTIYKWQRHQQFISCNIQDPQSNFVELTTPKLTKKSLQKATLCFDELAISVEGALSIEKLTAILNILEAR